TFPVRLLLRDWYLLTPTLIWKALRPSLVRQIHLSLQQELLARTIGLAREKNLTRR
ncbi:unnamed protein product, partial [Brassica rapa]